MRQPLRYLIGRFGDTKNCTNILNSTLSPLQHLAPYTQEFFNKLQLHPQRGNWISIQTTATEFQEW